MSKPDFSTVPIPAGFCQCGCGGITSRTKKARPEKGMRKGDSYPFVHGHGRRLSIGAEKMRALCEQGFSQREIAEMYGRTQGAVSGAMKRYRISAKVRLRSLERKRAAARGVQRVS